MSHPPGTAGRHTTLDGWNPSAGQALLVPLQLSATSQLPADARHTVPDGCTWSAGQDGPAPVHVSATSHPPGTAGRHTALEGWKPSAGHVALEPVQVSATSQTSTAARHTVVGGANDDGLQVPSC